MLIIRLIAYYCSLIYWHNASVDSTKKMQLKKFNNLFQYACRNSEFYHHFYKEAGVLNLKINSFDDIKKIPIIDKTILKKYSIDKIITTAITPKLNQHMTSGSSGEPFKIYFDKYSDYSAHIRVFFALRKIAHYNPLKKITLITRYKEKDKFQVEGDLSLISKLQRFLGIFQREIISIYSDPDYIIDRIYNSTPYILWSTPSILEIVVNRMIEKNISMQIPFLFFTSENLSPLQYSKFNTHLSKNIVDIYGAMESPCLGFELNKCGQRIVYPNSNLFEIINLRNTDNGETGDVIITNLMNYTMPIIRYDLKDICMTLNTPGFPNKEIGEIVGRIDDILEFPDGTKFAHHHAYEMFMDFEECDHYKIVQLKDKTIQLQIKPNPKFLQQEVIEKAHQRWNKRFPGEKIEIILSEKFEINPLTGKFKNIEKL